MPKRKKAAMVAKAEVDKHEVQAESRQHEAAHENGHAARHVPPMTASGGPGTVRENGHAVRHAHIANPSSHRRPARKLPGTLGITAGDLTVRLIDKGDNLAGIGIRVEVPEGRELTDAEKDVIRRHAKGTDEDPSGFRWDQNNRMWHKHIARDGERAEDIPPSRAVAIRLDAERRVEGMAEDLRRLLGQGAGFAAAEEQRREAAHGAEHSPS